MIVRTNLTSGLDQALRLFRNSCTDIVFVPRLYHDSQFLVTEMTSKFSFVIRQFLNRFFFAAVTCDSGGYGYYDQPYMILSTSNVPILSTAKIGSAAVSSKTEESW